jgi:phosphoserine phosphatase RsbU/P
MEAIVPIDPRPAVAESAGSVESRISQAVEILREVSQHSDPRIMYRIFSRRIAEAFPAAIQVTLGRRWLQSPQYRVTRFTKWDDEVDPWTETQRLPVHVGGLFEELLYAGEPRIVDEIDLEMGDPAGDYLHGQRSLIAIPLFDDGEASSLLVLGRPQSCGFAVGQVPEILWMCNLFRRATQTAAVMQKLQAANDQNFHEMKQIARMQKSLLPKELPQNSNVDLAVYCRSTAAAGGDYYDFLKLPRGRLGILVADVSGHGASAAMLVAVLHSLIKTYSGPGFPPGHLLKYVNDHLARLYTRSFGTFVTAVFAIYDPDRGTLSWSNAGHPPPRLIRADGTCLVLKGERCIPLGILDDSEYPEDSIELRPGDGVLLHTDGITDAKGPGDEAFGEDRVDGALSTVSTTQTVGARGMVHGILGDLERFTGTKSWTDDCTLIALKFDKSKKKAGEISGEWQAIR